MVAPTKPSAVKATKDSQGTTQRSAGNNSKQKLLSLNETIAKWRSLNDEQTVSRLEKLLQAPATDLEGKAKAPLSESTLCEYMKSLRLLQTRLAEEWSGQPRHALPSYLECLVRPTGPKFVEQFLADPAEACRIAICMASVVARCFGSLDTADRERATKAWRALLSSSRREYLQSRDKYGGFGGYVDEAQLLTAQEIQDAIAKMPVGSADRVILRLLEGLVHRFPEACKVNSPLLNLGAIKIVAADSAPMLDAWANAVAADDLRECGLLVLSNPPKLMLLFDVKKDDPVAMQYELSGALAAEIQAYLSRMPSELPWLFPQVKGLTRKSSRAYGGSVGRDSFNARVNRILSKVFGDAVVTQTIFRLSIVQAQRKQHEMQIASIAANKHSSKT